MCEIFRPAQLRTLFFCLWAASFQLAGGCHLWNSVRGNRSVAIAVLSAAMVVAGALILGLQRQGLGRACLSYAGVLVIATIFWNWHQTRSHPDFTDYVGGIMVLGGIGIIVLTPRP